MNAVAAVRVGGPNSGHTVIDAQGAAIIFRQLPTAALLKNVYCVLPAGSYIQPSLLLEEIRIANLTPGRLLIDPLAVILTDREMTIEQSSSLRDRIGSTLSGTGAAVSSRIARINAIRFAHQEKSLEQYVHATVPFLREKLNKMQRVIVEGTQGFGLSVMHSPHYPFTTSRDTTASGILSESGLSPLDVDDIALVIRAFPIRVSGNSGPLLREISWELLRARSRSDFPETELTSVTRKQRRIAEFDPEIVKLAIMHNKPTRLFLNHIDYVDVSCRQSGQLTEKAQAFIHEIEEQIGMRVDYAGIGADEGIEFTKTLAIGGCDETSATYA
jgi:adenylosuccinate synthase